MRHPHGGQAAVLFAMGKVANLWTSGGQLNVARFNHIGTLFPDGGVLALGGEDYFLDPPFASVELGELE